MPRLRSLLLGLTALVLASGLWAAPAGAIIGGRPTADGEGPWMVALIDGSSRKHPVQGQFCGGALIAPKTVLTAAHCLVFGGRPLVVRSRVLPEKGATRDLRDVREVVVHPAFTASADAQSQLGDPNDIGLLRLKAPLPGPYLRTAGPGDDAAYAPGAPLRIFGWGNRSRTGPNLPRQLHTGVIERFTDARCDDQYGRGFDAPTMFCAGTPSGSVDTCEGDSGGPVVGTDAKGGDVLVGLVSFGHGCGEADFPGVYTRVAHFARYLASNPRPRGPGRARRNR